MGNTGSPLTPVNNVTRREIVVDSIRRAIVAGELAPGEKVKEAPLAAQLGVSRPTVREAFYQLIHEGSLVQTPFEGIAVARPTSQDLLDVATVRVQLETLAALHVAEDPDGHAMTLLREALDLHLAAIRSKDLLLVDSTHLALHRTLWEGAGNKMMMRIWPLVESQIRMAMTLDQVTRSDLDRDSELHRCLVNVIASGDAAAISAEVRSHILTSADEVVALLRDVEAEQELA